MRKLILFFAVSLTFNSAMAQTFDDFVTSVARQTGDRFESSEALICSNGNVPNLRGYYQYSSSEQRIGYWSFGTAKTHAPYIWLGKNSEGKSILGLTAAVSVDWVFCDDDGDTFERSSSFPFRAIYSGEGLTASPTLSRLFFVRNSQGQSTSLVNPGFSEQTFDRLRDFDPYATGQIDGPSDEPILFENPASIQMSFEQGTDSSSFVAVFKNACGVDQNLSLLYKKSICDSSDSDNCNEMPGDL